MTRLTPPPVLTFIDNAADDSVMSGKRGEEDPVVRLQEAARWSSFTNSWLRMVAPGRAPRWVRRMIIGVFVLMAVVGFVVGLTGLVTRHESPTQQVPRDCPRRLEPGQTTTCIQLFPTGP